MAPSLREARADAETARALHLRAVGPEVEQLGEAVALDPQLHRLTAARLVDPMLALSTSSLCSLTSTLNARDYLLRENSTEPGILWSREI